MDLGMFTPWGPYYGIPDVDSFDATFSVLQYVNETLAAGPSLSLAEVRQILERDAGIRGGAPATIADAIANDTLLAKALPTLNSNQRSNVAASLRQRLANQIVKLFGPEATENPPVGIFEALWAHAHFSSDWELIRQNWPAIRKRFTAGGSVRWAGFGRLNVPAGGDLGAPCAAFARLAYQAGDLESYDYACSLLARDLVLVWARHRGADYFRPNLPGRRLEALTKDSLPTELRESPAGWWMEGRGGKGNDLFSWRWARFQDWDVARFFGDYLAGEARRELLGFENDQQRTMSPENAELLARVRSLLENQGTNSQRFDRLIPAGPPTRFVSGPEREGSPPNSQLTTSLIVTGPMASAPSRWPAPGWLNEGTSTGEPWTFGQIRPVRRGDPQRVESIPLNWNTRLILVERP